MRISYTSYYQSDLRLKKSLSITQYEPASQQWQISNKSTSVYLWLYILDLTMVFNWSYGRILINFCKEKYDVQYDYRWKSWKYLINISLTLPFNYIVWIPWSLLWSEHLPYFLKVKWQFAVEARTPAVCQTKFIDTALNFPFLNHSWKIVI